MAVRGGSDAGGAGAVLLPGRGRAGGGADPAWPAQQARLVGPVGDRADARHLPDRLRSGAGAGGGDPVCRRAAGAREWTAVKQYGDRPQTPYDHATQIRDLLGYREFSAAEGEVAGFIASRVAKTRDSRRELFDRAVLWLIENRVLLPGISTLSRLVAEVRRA